LNIGLSNHTIVATVFDHENTVHLLETYLSLKIMMWGFKNCDTNKNTITQMYKVSCLFGLPLKRATIQRPKRLV